MGMLGWVTRRMLEWLVLDWLEWVGRAHELLMNELYYCLICLSREGGFIKYFFRIDQFLSNSHILYTVLSSSYGWQQEAKLY